MSRTGWKSLSGASASSSSKTSEVMGRGSWYSLRPTHAELRLPMEHQLVALQREGRRRFAVAVGRGGAPRQCVEVRREPSRVPGDAPEHERDVGEGRVRQARAVDVREVPRAAAVDRVELGRPADARREQASSVHVVVGFEERAPPAARQRHVVLDAPDEGRGFHAPPGGHERVRELLVVRFDERTPPVHGRVAAEHVGERHALERHGFVESAEAPRRVRYRIGVVHDAEVVARRFERRRHLGRHTHRQGVGDVRPEEHEAPLSSRPYVPRRPPAAHVPRHARQAVPPRLPAPHAPKKDYLP